ncbi:MAG TPA: hypothetical protein VHN18_21370 [Micromonosporaceae bacterium]|nr:hypothetical protein [Micromonosporaceae bacterium]
MIAVVNARLRTVRTAATRATVVPLLVRCAIVLVALAALAVAFPPTVFFGRALPVLLVMAVLPAVTPGRVGPTATVVVAVTGWLASTTVYGERVVLWRLLALAGALYLGHVLCALACTLPYDAEVGLDVVAAPVLRALGVLLVSGVLSILLLGFAGRGVAVPSRAALLAGLAGAVGAAAILGWLLRRR